MVLIGDIERLGQDSMVRELEGRSSVQKGQWLSGSHFHIYHLSARLPKS